MGRQETAGTLKSKSLADRADVIIYRSTPAGAREPRRTET